jgi:hypothetical protein
MEQRFMAAVVHDPEGRLARSASREARKLCEIYESVCVVATPETAASTLEPLLASGVRIAFEEAGRIGESRRRALRNALEAGALSVHYCDLDRALYWTSNHGHELRTLAQSETGAFALLGRTRRAWLSHPASQRVTEELTNTAISSLIGLRVDATAGSCLLSKEVASLILSRSTEPTNATDGEWPAIVYAALGSSAFISRACDGLAFETPTYYAEEVANTGSLEAWVKLNYDKAEVWRARMQLSLVSIDALIRIVGRKQVGP